MYFAFVIVIFLATMAEMTAGWRIPEGQPDGLYHVFILENGQQIHTRIGEIPSSVGIPDRDSPDFDAGLWHINCQHDIAAPDIDHHVLDLANTALDQHCDSKHHVEGAPGNHLYALSNCSIAYMCHFSTGILAVLCSGSERASTSKMLTDRCGLYQPGYANLTRGQSIYKQTKMYGYDTACTLKPHNYCV